MKKGLQLTLLGLSAFIFSCQKDAAKNDVSSPSAKVSSASSASSAGLVKNSPFNLFPNSNRGGGGEDGGGGDPCKSCTITYPDSSNLPRSSAIFSESDVLVAATPGPLTCGAAPVDIKLWYSDEHALTLGIRQVVVKTSSGTTTTNYAVAPTPTTTAGTADYPAVGTMAQSGDQTGNDVAVGGGRPCWPIMYVTDLTGDPLSRAGDWQQGGIGINPSKIYGTWKAAVRTVDKTHNPALVTINTDADPHSNGSNLAGGDPFPSGYHTESYTAEVIWHVADLGLLPGHTYRLEFMVHDGDQNKAGGDAGSACTVIVMPGKISHPND